MDRLILSLNESNNREEYIIMDLKGKIEKRVFLPKFKHISLVGSILGTKLHTIQGNVLYYLSENEDTEEWEFHKVQIN